MFISKREYELMESTIKQLKNELESLTKPPVLPKTYRIRLSDGYEEIIKEVKEIMTHDNICAFYGVDGFTIAEFIVSPNVFIKRVYDEPK